MPKKSNERAHNAGAEFKRESGNASGFVEFADKAVEEVGRIGRTAFTKDNAPKLAAGAALGAVAAIALPIVSVPFGALAGLGYVAWRKSNEDAE
ncbi:MAG: hypothetical protein IT553_05535 [Sphingomonadaceae bacterium]|nr:hypothetical protein [Sphingomonadaceae bacterium]